MKTVRVERTIDAPIEDVFGVLTDHAGYAKFVGVRSAELVKQGSPDRNGKGAVRRIKTVPLVFEEEITGYDPPHRMDYLILTVNAPFEHKGGTMSFEERDGATHVHWVSTFRVPTPVVGGLLTLLGVAWATIGFKLMLRATEKRLAAGEPATARP